MAYLPPLILVSIQCPDVACLGPMGKDHVWWKERGRDPLIVLSFFPLKEQERQLQSLKLLTSLKELDL